MRTEKKKREKEQRNEEIEERNEETRKEREKRKEERRKNLIEKYGKEDGIMIFQGKISETEYLEKYHLCPKCNKENSLKLIGPGVERLAEEIELIFPNYSTFTTIQRQKTRCPRNRQVYVAFISSIRSIHKDKIVDD